MYNNSILVTQSGYYDLQDFDSILYVKVIQIFIFVLFCVYILVTDSYIVRVITRKENIQTTANVLICVLLVIDNVYAVYFTINSTVIIIKGNIWLTDVSARILAFINMMIPNIQYVLFLLVSIEKFIYCAFPYKHQIWFTKKKTFAYVAASITFVLVANIGMPLDYSATFLPSLLQCYILPDIDGMFSEGYKFPVRKLFFCMRFSLQIGSFLGTMSFQVCILISAILSRRKLKIQTHFPHHLEKRLWRRKFTNAFSLFSVIVAYVIGWLWMVFAIESETIFMHPAIQRTGVIFFIFISAMINPIAILLGNNPLREAVLNKDVKPPWLIQLPVVTSRQNTLDQEQTTVGAGTLHSTELHKENDMVYCITSSVVQSNFRSVPNLHHDIEVKPKRRVHSTADIHTARCQQVNSQKNVTQQKRDGNDENDENLFPDKVTCKVNMEETKYITVQATNV